jgi:hypothetical protein
LPVPVEAHCVALRRMATSCRAAGRSTLIAGALPAGKFCDVIHQGVQPDQFAIFRAAGNCLKRSGGRAFPCPA